jgi:lysine/ornithine N-monooxygenase
MQKHYENIIVGGGPAALQCAYFFEKHGIDYIIFEKNDQCGSFFSQFPHSGRLISINKKYTGSDRAPTNPECDKDFDLRHDWNSLLTDDNFSFKQYSDDFYPTNDCLVKYLNDFAEKYQLKIKYGTRIKEINKYSLGDVAVGGVAETHDETKVKLCDKMYKVVAETGDVFTCNKLIIATGLGTMDIPENFQQQYEGDRIKHYSEYKKGFFLDKKNLSEFVNKHVAIVGGGNSSYELANILNEITSNVTIICKDANKFAIKTHYAGDLRGVYTGFLDTFFLKSLNAVDDGTLLISKQNITKIDPASKYRYAIIERKNNAFLMRCFANRKFEDYSFFDKVILCTGWKFDASIFKFDVALDKKLPKINTKYESANNHNLFFIGSLMQSLDYKKSSGAFIHGFRYLIKCFVNINYNLPNQMKLIKFGDRNNYDIFLSSIVQYIILRMNTSSAIYQMFGYLADVIFYNKQKKEAIYQEEIPYRHTIDRNTKYNDQMIYFIITLEYGAPVNEIDKLGKRETAVGHENKSTLLHPLIQIYDYDHSIIDVVNFDEDLYAIFTDKKKYVDKLERLLRSYIFV